MRGRSRAVISMKINRRKNQWAHVGFFLLGSDVLGIRIRPGFDLKSGGTLGLEGQIIS